MALKAERDIKTRPNALGPPGGNTPCLSVLHNNFQLLSRHL